MLADRQHWISLTILVAATLGIDYVYLAPGVRWVPAKFIVPGTVFLLAFQIVPILYTIQIAFSNYSTGHVISRGDAIKVDQGQLAAAASERTAVRDGAGP